MKLENGYKVIYEVIDDTNRTFKASKTGSIVDAEVIAEFARGSYKLVYQRGNKLFGSVKNVPTDEDVELTDFDKVFVAAEDNNTEEIPAVEEPAPVEEVADEEPVVEDVTEEE